MAEASDAIRESGPNAVFMTFLIFLRLIIFFVVLVVGATPVQAPQMQSLLPPEWLRVLRSSRVSSLLRPDSHAPTARFSLRPTGRSDAAQLLACRLCWVAHDLCAARRS